MKQESDVVAPEQAETSELESHSVAYSNVVPVDAKQCIGLGVSQASCKQFAASQNTAELNLIEFFHAQPYFPIAFTRQQNNDYRPCAVLGIQQAENLFLNEEGGWQDGVYSPAYIRRFPFITQTITFDELRIKATELRKPVYVDMSALHEDSASLFMGTGEATEHWNAVDAFISDYISAERQTLLFTQKLNTLNLLEPFDAQIQPNQGEKVTLKGLHRVNENKLNKLPAKVIKELMQSGWLSRIYAHLISLENFAKLLDRKAKDPSS